VVDRIDDSAALLSVLVPPASPRAARAADETQAPRATPEEVFALVYSQVRKLAGRRDVEELAQMAAEQAIRALPRFEGRSQLSTWTYRICYLTIRKHDRWYRRWLRRFTLTLDGELPERGSEGDGEREGGPADDRLAESERLARLRIALEQLSPKRRAVVVLHDIEGLAIDEIATVVDAAPVAVRSRLRDGRKMLAEILESDPFFGDEACRRKVKK
jgi:RNA polymerase sigma-70 factor, ECF subfamily